MVEIILVDIINFQNYILTCIQNLLLFDNNNITVIIDRNLEHFFDSVKDNVQFVYTETLDTNVFDKKNKMDTKFRNQFWKSTSKRHFLLYEYMKLYDKKDIFHIENDVMVYENLDVTYQKIKNNFDGDEVFITMMSEKYAIPGFIFIPTHRSYEKYITEHDHKIHDMYNLAIFYKNNKCKNLPSMKQNDKYDNNNYLTEYFNIFNCVFDHASIGQYLGGPDIIHSGNKYSPGFINTNGVINYSGYEFFWIKDEKERYVPHIKINNKNIKIVNLHIHCKKLEYFSSVDPKEETYIKKC